MVAPMHGFRPADPAPSTPRGVQDTEPAAPRPPTGSAAAQGAALAAALAGAGAAATRRALAKAARLSHPFVAMAAARLLSRGAATPAARLETALAAAEACGMMGLQHSAAAHLAEAGAARLAPRLHDRLAQRSLLAALGRGDRAGAVLHLGAAPPDLAALLRWLPDAPPPDVCRALLAEPGTDPRLRAWFADRGGAALDPEDPCLALAGAEGRVAEPLLRRNLALARGQAGRAAALLARAFTAQGLEPPAMPDGFASLQAGPVRPAEGPLVSIVVSAFQAEATLPLALASVLAQSWRSIEVLVVDDASIDGTASAIARAAAADPRVRPLAQRRNAGPYAARNLALRAARGAFVTFHDADDWMHPSRIETEVAAFADPRVQVANSLWFRVDAAGRAVFRPRAPLAYGNPSFAMFRAGALRRLGCYDPVRFGADAEMMWRARLVLGARAMAVLPVTLAIGLSRPGSLTTAATSGMDLFGYSAPRIAYNEAWAAWHRGCDARGAVPWIRPGSVPPHHAGLPQGMATGAA
jgi:hypothetical protein